MKLHLKMLAKSIQIVWLGFLAIVMVCLLVLASAAYSQHRVDVNMAKQEAIQSIVDYTE